MWRLYRYAPVLLQLISLGQGCPILHGTKIAQGMVQFVNEEDRGMRLILIEMIVNGWMWAAEAGDAEAYENLIRFGLLG